MRLLVPLLLGGVPALAQEGPQLRTGGERWGAGYFPNVELTSHEGEKVRFFDDLLKDKVVVINFIYTSCPDVCPLETARLSELQAVLGERVGDDVFMYSITIDPEVDTPEVLAAYAERFQAGPGWLFLTGEEADITLLRKKLALYRPEIENGTNDHDLSLIIGNQRTGRWMKRSPFENPYFLANQVGSWLHNWKEAAPNLDSYANAPELRHLTTGENLFRTRCSACHVIGRGELVPPHQSGRLLGPDLLNVTERRDREWLARWLATPDQLLAEGDPIAAELYERHGRVAMPNLSLNDRDVEALLDFLETESLRVERTLEYEDLVPPSELGAVPATAECCQKNEAAVLGERERPRGTTMRRLPVGGAVGEEHRASTASIVVSAGFGCAFLLLAAAVRRRRPTADR